MHGNDPSTLQECHDEIERLREENDQLRQSANLFGDLAERLNLKYERRLGRERRMAGRPELNRRHDSSLASRWTTGSE